MQAKKGSWRQCEEELCSIFGSTPLNLATSPLLLEGLDEVLGLVASRSRPQDHFSPSATAGT